jgi:hypothetical protein
VSRLFALTHADGDLVDEIKYYSLSSKDDPRKYGSLLERIVSGLGARPDTGMLFKQVTFHAMRTAMTGHTDGQVRQEISRVDPLCFQVYFKLDMVTVTGLSNFPGLVCHKIPPFHL